MPPTLADTSLGLIIYVQINSAAWGTQIARHLQDIVLRLRYFRARCIDLFWSTDPVPVELASGLAAAGWALILAFAPEPLQREDYLQLKQLGTSTQWAVCFGILSFFQLARITLNCSRELFLHQLCSGAAMVLWLFVATALVWQQPKTASSTAYIVLALGCVWAFLRTGVDSGPNVRPFSRR